MKTFILIAIFVYFARCDVFDHDFPPGTPVNVTNPMFFSISESCTITSTDDSDDLVAVMVIGTATLNGNPVGTGLTVTVKNNEILTITATSYAEVTITNTGKSLVHAHCVLGGMKRKDRKMFRIIYKKVSKVLKENSIGHYDFAPNTPVQISNPLVWSVSASCHVHTADPTDDLAGTMVSGTGSLNGKDVGKGLTLTVKDGDSFTISASAWAEVEITNKGVTTLHADCSLSEESKRELEFVKKFIERHHRKKF